MQENFGCKEKKNITFVNNINNLILLDRFLLILN